MLSGQSQQEDWPARNRRALYFGLGLVVILLAISLTDHRIAYTDLQAENQQRAYKLKRLLDDLELEADELKQAAGSSDTEQWINDRPEIQRRAFDLQSDVLHLQSEVGKWVKTMPKPIPTSQAQQSR